jgi:hypothetical protein
MLHMGFKIVTKPLLFSSGFPMLRKWFHNIMKQYESYCEVKHEMLQRFDGVCYKLFFPRISRWCLRAFPKRCKHMIYLLQVLPSVIGIVCDFCCKWNCNKRILLNHLFIHINICFFFTLFVCDFLWKLLVVCCKPICNIFLFNRFFHSITLSKKIVMILLQYHIFLVHGVWRFFCDNPFHHGDIFFFKYQEYQRQNNIHFCF